MLFKCLFFLTLVGVRPCTGYNVHVTTCVRFFIGVFLADMTARVLYGSFGPFYGY